MQVLIRAAPSQATLLPDQTLARAKHRINEVQPLCLHLHGPGRPLPYLFQQAHMPGDWHSQFSSRKTLNHGS